MTSALQRQPGLDNVTAENFGRLGMGPTPRKSRIPALLRSDADPNAVAAKRRGFLLALGAGGIGAAAVATRALTGAPLATANEGTDAVSGEGYGLTDHVKRYYQTTKL